LQAASLYLEVAGGGFFAASVAWMKRSEIRDRIPLGSVIAAIGSPVARSCLPLLWQIAVPRLAPPACTLFSTKHPVEPQGHQIDARSTQIRCQFLLRPVKQGELQVFAHLEAEYPAR
jgi:hypothetical protein